MTHGANQDGGAGYPDVVARRSACANAPPASARVQAAPPRRRVHLDSTSPAVDEGRHRTDDQLSSVRIRRVAHRRRRAPRCHQRRPARHADCRLGIAGPPGGGRLVVVGAPHAALAPPPRLRVASGRRASPLAARSRRSRCAAARHGRTSALAASSASVDIGHGRVGAVAARAVRRGGSVSRACAEPWRGSTGPTHAATERRAPHARCPRARRRTLTRPASPAPWSSPAQRPSLTRSRPLRCRHGGSDRGPRPTLRAADRSRGGEAPHRAGVRRSTGEPAARDADRLVVTAGRWTHVPGLVADGLAFAVGHRRPDGRSVAGEACRTSPLGSRRDPRRARRARCHGSTSSPRAELERRRSLLAAVALETTWHPQPGPGACTHPGRPAAVPPRVGQPGDRRPAGPSPSSTA